MTSSTKIILTNPEDWEPWLADVQAVADTEIWKHVEPEDSDANSDSGSNTEEAAVPPLLQRPIRPKVRDFDQNARTYAQLNANSQKAYDNARNYYYQDLKYFLRQQDFIQEMRRYISDYTSPQKKALLDPKLSVKEWLVRLKENTKPSKAFMRRKVHNQYNESLKGLSKTTKIGQWLDKWELAMKLAEKYNLPQMSAGIWLLDIAQAVRPLSDTLYMTYTDQANDPEKSKPSQYRNVARRLREAFQSSSRKTATARGSTFNTDFGSEEHMSEAEDSNRKRSQSRKRAGTTSIEEESTAAKRPKSKCPACEYKGHTLQDCWILFENKRPEGYKPSKAAEARAKKVKESVAQDEDLAAQVDKIRRQAGTVDKARQQQEVTTEKVFKGEANMVLYESSFQASIHPLKLSAILGSGAALHVFNDLSRFLNFRKAPRHHYLISGNGKVPILGYGDIQVEVTKPDNSKGTLRLKNVAFCTDFATNLVSFRLLREKGYYWDNKGANNSLKRQDGTVMCEMKVIHGQQVIEYIPLHSCIGAITKSYPSTLSPEVQSNNKEAGASWKPRGFESERRRS